MIAKNIEDRVRDLESWAFQAGRDLAEIKSILAEDTERLAVIEQGVALLLNHCDIERPGTESV
ncbi:hypothetical protein SAMN05216276_1008158 [Streptosporangium subroseum]|uniref:Uncharacterized protein n=1 Tax=Streptosporangium subroseum TaxID=106412 RepID=A0A239E217_9ACTN|nr:hypothetical protein [Streptosporangium subroseum]SNS38022.1 hypothetical protein SAMN05216276_1008158 [Streptosporangium subroseum]